MDPIITLARINAAAQINRWRGWTKRPYSILEHMVIGVEVMEARGYVKSAQRMFLLHDMHETEIIGDVPTPDKRAYCNEAFHVACDKFDADMYRQLGWSFTGADRLVCSQMDNEMLIVENAVIASRPDNSLPKYVLSPSDDDSALLYAKLIANQTDDIIARFVRNFLRLGGGAA